ncbi:hypothetical protein ACFOD4_03120 [Pseudoroseomonas globiformis]|uniref:Uncharacterized protein n=1 Tax=Teichococcus globiformis TaxID=2307229 RepID=A0ABV7FZ42_9PROT
MMRGAIEPVHAPSGFLNIALDGQGDDQFRNTVLATSFVSGMAEATECLRPDRYSMEVRVELPATTAGPDFALEALPRSAAMSFCRASR